jgi:glycosyltransferase involved in cell wall biosynthesis
MGRVVIDARAAARPELGGVERWARELTARLPAIDPERYVVAQPPPALAHRAGHAWEQLVLPVQAARADAILCPANLAPLASRRTVVVLHDVAPLREPAWYSSLYVRWQRAVLPRIACHAARIVTPSAFSRNEVVELLGVPESRVDVVPGGVDPRFTPQADAAAARAALDLGSKPYVLTVASRTARKNLNVLDLAARRLAARGVDLVAAGGDRPQFRAENDDDHGVRPLGHVDDALLPGLYAGAAAFVLPSLYEGFGLTALEALAAGVPVVAADRGALPEVCGDAALLVDPTDAEAVATALERVLDDPEPWRAAGPPRAAPLTWASTAAAVDATMDAVLA